MSAINKDTQACASACASTSEPDEKEVEEYDENVAALQLLFESRNPPAQSVQSLLDVTRPMRQRWLQTDSISIGNILEKFPPLEHPKWVS